MIPSACYARDQKHEASLHSDRGGVPQNAILTNSQRVVTVSGPTAAKPEMGEACDPRRLVTILHPGSSSLFLDGASHPRSWSDIRPPQQG